ncbi:MAG: polysaccharide deacetylase family protein [Gemmatimonadaceae bacterium]
MAELRCIRVGLHPSLRQSDCEAKYVLRTLLRVAGFPYEFVWADGAEDAKPLDIYYGPAGKGVKAVVRIPYCDLSFRDAPSLEPSGMLEADGLPQLFFRQSLSGSAGPRDVTEFASDIVFSSYWLLAGAREPSYLRDRWDNLHIDGSFFQRASLASKPLVSVYGTRLRASLQAAGYVALERPWARDPSRVAFAFSHDVDYPETIRWIETLRLLRARGAGALASISGVWRGTNHFWKFADWIEFERRFGARPAFYFLARKGSLLEYATGTPDGFYDVRSPRFRRLFGELRDQGCEIGLHASYNAHRSVAQLRLERETLEDAAGVQVKGNRHHFWHLDPEAPHETLRKHEEIGLAYDSSLGLEFYPGFRRGICHPFRVFHPGERRELDIVQIAPAWMDDHFDRRLVHNAVTDPDACARALLDATRDTGGVLVVDYHVRGMNADFYPRYGPWLTAFIERNADDLTFSTPGEIADMYVQYEQRLSALSRDRTVSGMH